jgi:hypothetical protein
VCDGKLFDGNVSTLWILNNDGRAMSAVAEEGSAGVGEIKPHGLIRAFCDFKGTTGSPEDIVPELGVVGAA